MHFNKKNNHLKLIKCKYNAFDVDLTARIFPV